MQPQASLHSAVVHYIKFCLFFIKFGAFYLSLWYTFFFNLVKVPILSFWGAVPFSRGRDRVNPWSLCVPKDEMLRRLDFSRHLTLCTHVTTTLYSFDLFARLGINLQTCWSYFPCTNHSSSVLIFCTNHFFGFSVLVFVSFFFLYYDSVLYIFILTA